MKDEDKTKAQLIQEIKELRNIKESEFFFKESQRISLVGSYKLDFNTGFWVSSQFLDDLFGIDANYVRSVEGWVDLIHPDDAEMMDRYLKQEVFGKHKPFGKEYRIIRKVDGEIRWVNGRGELSLDTEGNIISMIGTIHDITERKQAEDAILSSEKQLKFVTDHVPVSIAQCDINQNYIFVNQSYAEMFKSSVENIVGKQIRDVIGKDAYENARLHIAAALNGQVNEYDILLPEDSRTVHVKYVPKYDSSGCVTGFLAGIIDVTKRKQAEIELNRTKNILDETTKISKVGGWELDFKTMLPFFSEETYRIYEISPTNPLLMEDVINFYAPEGRSIIRKAVNDAIEKNIPYDIEVPFITAKGNNLWVRAQGKVFKEDGLPTKLIGTIQDITEKRKLEESMQKSQKLESIGVLAGGIAHDFNNLLSGILKNIELAKLKNTEEEVSTYLARSLSSIHRARSLTGQLLTFAKGGAPIKKVESLFLFIKETTLFSLSGSSVSCRFQIDEDLWLCNCDKNQIGQVIDNLTRNAQQAMPNGGTIEISARNISLSEKEHHSLATGNYIKLTITDHGIGISKELLPSIFDPYYTTKSIGQGLGLSTCFSIINRHGGCIDVESELGEGCTFHVYLPASIESVLTKAEGHTERGSFEHAGNGTFLVMDDDRTIRESMKDILEDFGYTVVLKENGKDAIDFFIEETKANRKLAGMIFDLTIPGGMGGEEAIGEIRKINVDTPAFVASGYSSNPVMANPEEYGFNASICKPFMMDELSEMLEKHMKK